MPITFPAHAAAVLPFIAWGPRSLPPLALVLGTIVPDAALLVREGNRFSHTVFGLFVFCVPLGVALYAASVRWILPAVCLSVPRLVPLRRPARSGGWVVLAVLIGATTHLLWDSFTHDWSWPGRLLFPNVPVTFLGQELTVADLLHRLSSYVGTVVFVVFAVVAWRRLPTATATAAAPSKRLPLFVLIAAATLGSLIALEAKDVVDPAGDRLVPLWVGIVGGWLGLLLASLYLTRTRTRTPTHVPRE